MIIFKKVAKLFKSINSTIRLMWRERHDKSDWTINNYRKGEIVHLSNYKAAKYLIKNRVIVDLKRGA